MKRHTTEDVVQCALSYSPGTRFTVLAPVRVPDGRTLREQLEIDLKQGLTRIDAGGEMMRIEDYLDQHAGEPDADPSTLALLIDRMSVSGEKDAIARLVDSAETAFFEGDGECMLRVYPSRAIHRFSTRFEADGMTFREPDDNMFSFNSPLGACPRCEGFGRVIGLDEALVVPNRALSVYDGAVMCWRGEKMGMWREEFCRRAEKKGSQSLCLIISLRASSGTCSGTATPRSVPCPRRSKCRSMLSSECSKRTNTRSSIA